MYASAASSSGRSDGSKFTSSARQYWRISTKGAAPVYESCRRLPKNRRVAPWEPSTLFPTRVCTIPRQIDACSCGTPTYIQPKRRMRAKDMLASVALSLVFMVPRIFQSGPGEKTSNTFGTEGSAKITRFFESRSDGSATYGNVLSAPVSRLNNGPNTLSISHLLSSSMITGRSKLRRESPA